MTFRDPSNDRFPSPAQYKLGSPESRAAARAMADAKREPPRIILLGRRASDGKPIMIRIYKGGHTETIGG
jgi:hypothetical protein